jgi:hypothetical protein
MNEALVERTRAWLRDPRARAHDVPGVDALAAALVDPRRADALLRIGPHGTTICFSPRPYPGPRRRTLEIDPAGNVVSALRWTDAGALMSSAVRTAGGDWIGVDPRATSHPIWGPSDRLWRLGEPPDCRRLERLTVFESLDWASIDHIPPLAEPARLPPGAGTAVLNLIAGLAADHGRARLDYRGPYATEQLFTALLESFQPVREPMTADDDPLRSFLAGRLAWRPAPHERHFPRPDLCLQLRGRIEKVVWRGRVYYRPDWPPPDRPPILRRTSHAVRDAGGLVHCSLCALGAVVEDHLILDPLGSVVATLEPAADPRPPAPMDPRIHDGLGAIVRATSAGALGRSIGAVMAPLTVEWVGLTGDLAAIGADRVGFAWRLAEVGATRIRAASTVRERFGRALELLTEMAHLVGDALRSRAQAALAAKPQPDPLDPDLRGSDVPGSSDAPGCSDVMDAERIVTATQALVETLGGGLGSWATATQSRAEGTPGHS